MSMSMNEIEFKQQLFKWQIREKAFIIPTSAEILLYGHHDKTKIISKEHQYLIYECIKPLEIPDDLYKRLAEEMKLTDPQILKFVQKTYEQKLKDIRKSILKIQRDWSRNFLHYRARKIIKHLEYDDIYALCDLANYRIVPIELILKMVFNVKSNYGDYRRKKDKEEVHVDPRTLKIWLDRKEYASRTIIHSKVS